MVLSVQGASGHATIGAENLAVDPTAVVTREEGDDSGDVIDPAEAAERIHAGDRRGEAVT